MRFDGRTPLIVHSGQAGMSMANAWICDGLEYLISTSNFGKATQIILQNIIGLYIILS